MKYNNVIFFDGICNLCKFSVKFVHKHDKKELFYFSPIDSDFFNKLPGADGMKSGDSVIFFSDGKIYSESDAVLRIVGKLGNPWKLLTLAQIIPRGFRNRIYRFIANNRSIFRDKSGNCNLSYEIPEYRIIS